MAVESPSVPGVKVHPQLVRWGPSDSYPAGLRVWDTNNVEGEFVYWACLKAELDHKLLPQLFVDPSGYHIDVRDHLTKKHWLVQVIDESGNRYCDLWFGGDPENGWAFDGMVRVGDADVELPVWQTYQRYSDGSYRRLFSRFRSIDGSARKQ